MKCWRAPNLCGTAIDATSWPGRQDPRSTRLITIGHGFGGLIVYTALSQYFIDRVVQSGLVPFSQSLVAERARAEKEKGKEIAGYGDLVIIVNPAIEAIRFQPIRELLENRQNANSFAPKQDPVFVEVTSDADWATGIALPAGRLLNTTFESFTSENERNATYAGNASTSRILTGRNAPTATQSPAGAVPTGLERTYPPGRFRVRSQRSMVDSDDG